MGQANLSLRTCHIFCGSAEKLGVEVDRPGSSGSSPLKALLPRVQCHFEPGGAGALMAGKIFLGTMLDQSYLGCQSH